MLAEAFCSHRLRSRANTDIFHKLTVSDAFSRPDYFWKSVKSIPNLGTKSFDELERLLKKHQLCNDTVICEPYSLKLTQGQIRELMEVCCANDQRSKRVHSALLEELSTINDYEGLIRSIRSSPKRLRR